VHEPTPFATVALPVALALIMGTLGLSLRPSDFTRVFKQPRGVAIGLANLLAISPLLAFLVADLFGLRPEFAVGLVLLGASPGGTLANLLTHLARGDTALSISMTAISSILAVATVPLYLNLAIDHFGAGLTGDPSMLGVALRVFLITIVPLSIGMWVRARDERRAAVLEPRLKRVASAVFVAVVIGAVASEWSTVTANFGALALAALSLNVAAMTVSFAIARAARLDDRQATAISMELGIHNATLAIAVGASISDVLAIPAAVYSAFMFLSAGSFARLMFRRNQSAGATGIPRTAPSG
jgi:BASS family bile acid:Na+ symporter